MKDLVEKLFEKTWNFKNRNTIIHKLQNTEYDVLIIGGGITGAGIAREAAMRGLKVGLVEKQDFAAGTSSRSSKLAHGGLRYLAYGELALVKDAATERNWMRAHVPHLIRPVPFLWVNWKGDTRIIQSIKSALELYDSLSDRSQEFINFKKYQWFSAEELQNLEPHIKENQGGAIYYDTNVDDARLTIETLKEAVIRGADAVNYCEVKDYIKDNGKIIGVKCKDLEENNDFEIKGTLIVNATGIWTDELLKNYPDNIPKPLIRPTKGVHLIYRRKHIRNENAVIVPSVSDKRGIFVLPRGDFCIIGTSDTDFKGDRAYPFCTKEDADYFIKSVKHYIPSAKVEYENIVSTYAGVRPLVMQKGKSESDISRKHIIFFSDDGLLTITGGKLTTWRKMAEDLFTHVVEKGIFPNIEKEKNFSKQKFAIGLEREQWIKELKDKNIDLAEDIADHLHQQYGKGAFEILELIKEDQSLKERILNTNDFIKAEIVYILRNELTPHLIDVFCRRTEMSLFIKYRKQSDAAKKVADIMANEYQWDDFRKDQEIKDYIEYNEKTIGFI